MGQTSSAMRRAIAGLAGAAALIGPLIGAGVAQAADSDYLFSGDAYGGTIQPTPTAAPSSTVGAASLLGGPQRLRASNSLASAHEPDVMDVGAVATTAQITPTTGGWKIVSTARDDNVRLLGGLLTATSVTTRAAVSEVAGKLTTHITTAFVGLQIAGHTLPNAVRPNTAVKVGNKATFFLNTENSVVQDGSAEALGAGIQMVLGKPVGKFDTGNVVSVDPVEAIVGPAGSVTGHTNAGHSYASRVTASSGNLVGTQSDPTAPVTVFPKGTNGQTVSNSLAGIQLAPGLDLGAVTDTGLGTNTATGAVTNTTSKIGAVNLFNGLIKASSMAANASASSNGDISGSAQYVNLSIAGKPITLNVAPNTTTNVPQLGQVTLNQQIRTAHGITVRALYIVMGTARNGLPVGAKVQIGVAQAAAT